MNDVDSIGLTPLGTAALSGNSVAAAELLNCDEILKEVIAILYTLNGTNIHCVM